MGSRGSSLGGNSRNVPDMVGYLSEGMVPTPGGRMVPISPTSTGGKIVDQGGGQWYGENDNGFAVSILDSGDSPYNAYAYGVRRVYEVHKYDIGGAELGSPSIVTTKKDAMRLARQFLKAQKG